MNKIDNLKEYLKIINKNALMMITESHKFLNWGREIIYIIYYIYSHALLNLDITVAYI